MIGRRGFITGLVSLVAAPAIVRVASIMPVKVMPSLSALEMINRASERLINPPLMLPGYWLEPSFMPDAFENKFKRLALEEYARIAEVRCL